MNIRNAQIFSDMVVDALFKYKNEQGITNYRVSQLCGISETALNYIQHHSRRPTLYTLKLIADAVGVDLCDYIKAVQMKLSENYQINGDDDEK
jgi:transcriptional regulator with XRE-family HTH domain